MANVTSAADSYNVPVCHFGAILPMRKWETLASRLREAAVRCVIERYIIRINGELDGQATMCFLNPSGNTLEFKASGDLGLVFVK